MCIGVCVGVCVCVCVCRASVCVGGGLTEYEQNNKLRQICTQSYFSHHFPPVKSSSIVTEVILNSRVAHLRGRSQIQYL